MVDVKTQESTVEDKYPKNRWQDEGLADILVEEKGSLPVKLAVEETDVVSERSLAEFLGLEDDALAGCYLEEDFVCTFASDVAVLIELQMNSALYSIISTSLVNDE